MATAGKTEKYTLIAPPKEFFRQFANLAHNRVLNEDFPHEKLLTLKYKGIGGDFTVNAKGSLNIKSEPKAKAEIVEGRKVEVIEKKDSYLTSSEVKFLTAHQQTSTEARFNNKGITKVWTNWGVHKVGEPLEIVSVVKGDTQFNKTKAWVAAYWSRGSVASGTRVQVRRDKTLAFSLAQKLTFQKKDLWGGAYVDVNLTDLKLTQYNAVVGYNVNKNIHFYAEHITSKARPTPSKTVETVITTTEKTVVTEKVNGPVVEKTTVEVESKQEEKHALLKKIGFGKGTLTGAYKDNKIHALAQLGWEEPTEKLTLDAGVVYTINKDSSVRAKVNQDLNLALGGRHKCSKNVSVNVGTNVPLKNVEKFYNSFNTVPIPFGVSLEFAF